MKDKKNDTGNKKIVLYKDAGPIGGFEVNMFYLASSLEHLGYECEDVKRHKLHEALDDCDVLWISCRHVADGIGNRNEKLIKKYSLEKGHGLLLHLCGHPVDECEFYSPRTPRGFYSKCRKNRLGLFFGMGNRAKKEGYANLRKGGQYIFEDHPITKDLEEIGIDTLKNREVFSPLKIDEGIAKALISYVTPKEKQFPVVAINKNYTVAAFSSRLNVFHDDCIYQRDNLQFALNLFQWLCGDLEETDTRRKERPTAVKYYP